MKNLLYYFGFPLMIFMASCTGKSSNQSKEPIDSTTASIVETTSVNPAIKKYQIKSAIITFDHDLMGIKQKSILYFDDYGMKEAEEKYEGDIIKETNLCDGKNRYLLMHSQKTAYSSGSCFRGIAYKFDWNEISKADKEYKVNKLPDLNVAGKNCESYTMTSGNYPTVFAGWNNICLLMDSKSQFGKVIMKAVKVEENASIPSEKFTVPKEFEIKKGI